MNIELVKKPREGTAFLLVIKEGEKVRAHPFFRAFSKGDAEYLLRLEKKSPLKAGHSHRTLLPSGGEAVLLGVEKQGGFTYRKAMLAARRAVDYCRKERIAEFAVPLDDFATSGFGRNRIAVVTMLGTQFEIANFEFVKYKTPPKDGWFFVKRVFIHSPQTGKVMARSLAHGKIVGEEINKARILSNTPGGDMTPDSLAKEAVRTGKQAGFRVRVLGRKEMKKLGMGAILGVAQGSENQPRFIVMEYFRGKKNAASRKRGEPRPQSRREAPVVLVGKGVTFDTGGLNLKPTDSLYEMHMDMSGGASVIHVIAALARLKAKKNIVGLVPAVENMPSGSSYRPGDLLKTMSGKTIEVLNTDAEGRVILADALTYAERYKPRLVIDVATLTGAALVALGQRASAIFTTDQKLERAFREYGERTGDFVWPLPLWEEFEEEIKGTFGDVANTGKTRYGGAIKGAVFLWQFMKDFEGREIAPWVHIDIAPRMTSVEGEYLAKGSAGPGVGLLTSFLLSF